MGNHERYTYDPTCPKCAELEAQAAQPDRPEPVDPASVRVGDYVEVVQQHDDIPLRITVEGEVYQLGRDGDKRHLFYIRGYGGPAIADMTSVRILHREPEPDPAAVQAMSQLLHDIKVKLGSTHTQLIDTARELVRAGLEVPDA